MFWMKKRNDGKPVSLSAGMSRLIGEEWAKLPRNGDHWAEYLAVMRPQSDGGDVFDIRIYDKWVATEKKVQVLGYSSLDAHPELILLEGWFNQNSKKGEILARKGAL
jgi:hypothetical protein